jgi:hypothetical protein
VRPVLGQLHGNPLGLHEPLRRRALCCDAANTRAASQCRQRSGKAGQGLQRAAKWTGRPRVRPGCARASPKVGLTGPGAKPKKWSQNNKMS